METGLGIMLTELKKDGCVKMPYPVKVAQPS